MPFHAVRFACRAAARKRPAGDSHTCGQGVPPHKRQPDREQVVWPIQCGSYRSSSNNGTPIDHPFDVTVRGFSGGVTMTPGGYESCARMVQSSVLMWQSGSEMCQSSRSQGVSIHSRWRQSRIISTWSAFSNSKTLISCQPARSTTLMRWPLKNPLKREGNSVCPSIVGSLKCRGTPMQRSGKVV